MLFSARRFIRRVQDGTQVARGQAIIGELGASIGIPELALELNSCTLSIDGVVITIELDAAHSRFLISTYLADADASHGQLPYRAMMEGTLESVLDATGMVLGIDKLEDRIVMVTALFLDDLTGEDVGETLSRFVVKARHWRERLASMSITPSDSHHFLLTPSMLA